MAINDLRDKKVDIVAFTSPSSVGTAAEAMSREANPCPTELQQLQQSPQSNQSHSMNDRQSTKVPEATVDKEAIIFGSSSGAQDGANHSRDGSKSGANRAINGGDLTLSASYDGSARAQKLLVEKLQVEKLQKD